MIKGEKMCILFPEAPSWEGRLTWSQKWVFLWWNVGLSGNLKYSGWAGLKDMSIITVIKKQMPQESGKGLHIQYLPFDRNSEKGHWPSSGTSWYFSSNFNQRTLSKTHFWNQLRIMWTANKSHIHYLCMTQNNQFLFCSLGLDCNSHSTFGKILCPNQKYIDHFILNRKQKCI